MTTSQHEICIPCPAKLNVTLSVAPPRADGLHPIASLMVPIEYFDTLRLTRLNQGPTQIRRVVAPDRIKPIAIDWDLDKDLAYRAHALLQRTVDQELPITCTLSKRIPTGAGLGGGSANAAGMLVGLRALFNLNLSDPQLIELGQSLGADIAFAIGTITSRRPAVVTGIGQIITPCTALHGFEVVLVFPDGQCPTGAVYGALDQAPTSYTPIEQLNEQAARWQASKQLPAPSNDLTEAAIQVCPQVGQAIEQLACLGYDAHLTGSGSSLFILAENMPKAAQIAAELTQAGFTASTSRYAASHR